MIDGGSDNLRGEQRRAHDELEADRLIQKALALFCISDRGVARDEEQLRRKKAVDWLLKKKTTVTVVWITERLRMGHCTKASRYISIFEKGGG